jgi:tRNA(Arg) A34 adenosine deaminase TadA
MSISPREQRTDPGRRRALRCVACLSVAAFPVTAIAQPATASPASLFMERAYEMRRRAVELGDQPFGAVVVRDQRIVGEGVSAVITAGDPTAHAEMQAIRAAARALGTRDLSGCELYSTSRACPMCEAAAYWARIGRMVHGAALVDAGAPRLP